MEIQNIIFPEEILYDREISNYRTPKVNSAIRLITSNLQVRWDQIQKLWSKIKKFNFAG